MLFLGQHRVKRIVIGRTNGQWHSVQFMINNQPSQPDSINVKRILGWITGHMQRMGENVYSGDIVRLYGDNGVLLEGRLNQDRHYEIISNQLEV